MNMITVLHNKAMEFADEALLARMEGNEQASGAFFAKAFELEKEAALALRDGLDKKGSRYILLRSAASLAMQCGRVEEAKKLIDQALVGSPPQFILEELMELKLKLQQLGSDKSEYLEMIGVITSADAGNNEIKIQDAKSQHIYTISVPTNLFNDIVRSYWADLVQVKAQKIASGRIVLSQITKAA